MNALVSGKVYSCDTRHYISSWYRRLSLPLFVFRVITDHPHHSLAADDLALGTYLFNAGSNFHFLLLGGRGGGTPERFF